MTEPPPPRYRVVERGRRLEVIDTRTGAPVAPSLPGPDTPRTARIQARAGRPYRAIVIIACGGATDTEGRPILTTMSAIDSKAPRDIVLGPVGERRLGRLMIALVIVPVLMVIVAVLIWEGSVGALLVAIAFAATRVQSVATRWIDRLEALNGR